jgi:hypothetical protein
MATVIESVTEYAQDCYLTYPTANGFCGESLVAAQRHSDSFSLVEISLATGGMRTLANLPRIGADLLYFDAAGSRIVAGASGAVWLIEGDRAAEPLISGLQNTPIPSLSRDGQRIVLTLRDSDDLFHLEEYRVETGKSQRLTSASWWMNHAHFSPHDESWIGYCHEGPCEEVMDRVWGFHIQHAPQGKCLFDQCSFDGPLYVGHERWSFHDCSVFAVAYGVSPGEPRGIYEIFADGRSARLVSQGDRDWHVDVSRCGRWAVVDTTGYHDTRGQRLDLKEAGGVSDIVLIDCVTGYREHLTRTTNSTHPSHPHPVFSPDGRWIYFNECDETGRRNRIRRLRNPQWKKEKVS